MAAPKSVTIRTYQVGFGDCFLLSFQYGPQSEKHVLVDFGSTGLSSGVPKTRIMDIALDIEQRTGGKLHAVVATHRHKDHISGFETAKNGKGPGDVIRRQSRILSFNRGQKIPIWLRTRRGQRRKALHCRDSMLPRSLLCMKSRVDRWQKCGG